VVIRRHLEKSDKLKHISDLVVQGANVNAVSLQGLTPLNLACGISQDIDVIALLIDSGADPNLRGNSGWTALHTAAKFAPVTIVKYLLDHGADPKALSDHKETPLSLAINYPKSDPKTIELLKNQKASQ